MEKFSVVPTLKSLSAKTILRHKIPVNKNSIPADVSEYLEETGKNFFSFRISHSGTFGRVSKESPVFVNFVKIGTTDNLNTYYLIYSVHRKNGFGNIESSEFWDFVINQLPKILDKLSITCKLSQNEVDKEIYNSLSGLGNIQVRIRQEGYEKIYNLVKSGYSLFSTDVKRVLTQEDPLKPAFIESYGLMELVSRCVIS